MKKVIVYFVWVLLFLNIKDIYAQTTLYYSTQNGQHSQYNGSYSKTTDKHEEGTVSITTTGPIVTNPTSVYMGPNQTQNWTGSVLPDAAAAMLPGTVYPASVIGNYQVKYSRPVGSGYGGTVLSTYQCSESGTSGDGCSYHGGNPGTHEVIGASGQEILNFVVYSIKVTLPDTICVQPTTGVNSATSIQEATPFPDNGSGTFLWVAESNNITIANATSRNATITLNDTNQVGLVSVIYTVEGVTYKTTAVVKSCLCSCKPIINGVTFGQLAFTFNSNPDQSAPVEGFCSYTINDASLSNLKLVDFVTKETSLQNVRLTFKKNCETGEYKDITIDWAGNQNIGTIKYITASITGVSLTYDVQQNRINGSVGLRATLDHDTDLTGRGYVILKEGVNGNFTFNYQAGADAFSGRFDFNGISGINVDLYKDNKVIAQFTDGSLNADGQLSGTISALVGTTYRTNAFTVEMVALSVGFNWDLRAGSFELTNGTGTVKVKDIRAVTGEFVLGLDFNQNNCAASVQVSNVTAFGMALDEFNLSARFTYEFEMVELDGSLKAKHNSFDVKVGIAGFHVENGVLTRFDGNGSVKYSGFTFNLTQLGYTNAPSQLTITASAEINLAVAASLGVDRFTINEAGEISVGTIRGSVNKNPLDVSFTATFETNRFRGTFNAQFAAAGPITGTVDIGTTPACNFGYFSLTVGGLNVPLGQSGLKITQLGGRFGFNYDLAGGGNPQCGTYVLGGRLGVADIGNVCEVVADVTLQLGNENFSLTLNGTVNVLRNNQFLTANLDANYRLPQNTLAGTFRTNLNVPSSGWIFQSENVGFSFNVGGGNWNVAGSDMSGSMFKGFVQLSGGTINMSSGNGTAFTGNLGGTARIGYDYSAGVSLLGNDFTASVRLSMNSNINAAINQDGLNGAFGVNMNAGGSLNYTFFTGTGGSVNVNATANGNLSYNNGSVNVNGNMHVDLPFTISYPICTFGWAWDSECWANLNAIDFGVNISL